MVVLFGSQLKNWAATFLQLFEASLAVCSGAGPWWTLVMLVLDCGAKHIMGVAPASM